MKNSKSYKQFETSYKKIINTLRKKEYTLFENISPTGIVSNIENEYNKFKNSPIYWSYISENNSYIKSKMIDLFIFESIIDSVLSVKNKIELEENLNLTQEVLFETTFVALEEEFFKILNLNKDEQKIFKEIFESYFEENENLDKKLESAKNFLIKLIQFMKRTKDYSFGLFLFILLLAKTLHVYILAGTTSVLKMFTIDLFNLKNLLESFDEKILTAKLADPIVKEFLKKNYGFNIDDVIKKCWKSNINKHKQLVKKSNFEIIDKINLYLFEKSAYRSFFSSLNNPIFYNIANFLKDDSLNDFGHEVNICVFQKLKEFAVALAISSFEIGDVSEKLIKNLSGKNDILRVTSSFKQLYQTSSQNLNKAEKLFVESVMFLMDLKVLIDKLLMKKENIKYTYITKYESLSKSINLALKEIEEAYKRSKSFKDQNINKYEENYRQNNEKTLAGNTPTKPRKESLFDI